MPIPSSFHPNSIPDLIELHKKGEPYGVFSVCSANPFVLHAAMKQASQAGFLLQIESTANQVNQDGGYMGLTPAQFHNLIFEMKDQYGLADQTIILGGDHLGPTVWQSQPAPSAMEKAAQLVGDYVRSGYTKIHLDASMPLGGDLPGGPTPELAAGRTASLCLAAETALRDLPANAPRPYYVIGTEVPLPGGEKGNQAEIAITTVESASQTLEITRQAFFKAGLHEAWTRVIALVVQPGVEFGNQTIHPYHSEKAIALSRFIETTPGIVYEAHSTDYQTPDALRRLVEDHFAILKVGPALTFAFREAVFALEFIEQEILAGSERDVRSHLQEVLEDEMLAYPGDWSKYYLGSAQEQRILRRFSLSDRVRYYWTRPVVAQALERLLVNLRGREIPASLVSQFMTGQSTKFGQGSLRLSPDDFIQEKITGVIRQYRYACDPTSSLASFNE